VAFIPQETIIKKRDGKVLSDAEIHAFIEGVTDETVAREQVAAFAMATLFQKMTVEERRALTLAMRDSGERLHWDDLDLPGPIADKHSTGGVGDKVSLLLGPMAAACGLYVPMIAGRGLGHTGGTVDKFEAIPGYSVAPSNDVFRSLVKRIGVAIIGQTANLAPADRIIYGVRDITGTVESIDLITASILSKKLAAGLQSLVMDVKVGNGAFMATLEDARALARSIVDVANAAGCKTSALLTNMNWVLGQSAGNAVEVRESVLAMAEPAKADERLITVCVALVGEMLVNSGLIDNPVTARERARQSLDDGSALEKFGQMVAGLGGPSDFAENPDKHLAQAAIIRPVHAETGGFVAAHATRDLGVAIIGLGGGRTQPGAPIDHAVGLSEIAGPGAEVAPGGRPLAVIHAASEDAFAAAEQSVRAAISVAEDQPAPRPLELDVVR
jgi:thymidine phosphorylase